jgi:hypothetical protein
LGRHGLSLSDIGLDSRVSRGALRGERRLIAAIARYVLRRSRTLTRKYRELVRVVMPAARGRKIFGLAECRGRLVKLGLCIDCDLRIASCCIEGQLRVVQCGVAIG